MTHKDLIELGARWLYNKGYHVVLKELVTCAYEQPDVIGFRPTGFSFLLEAKTSRTDFLADKKKHVRQVPRAGMGLFRSFVCPKDLIKPEELPENWGLLYANNNRIKQIVAPKAFKEFNIHAEQTLLVSLARRVADDFEYKKYIFTRSR